MNQHFDHLVGRDELVHDLVDRLSEPEVGARCLVIEGVAGVGKSAVVRHVLAELAQHRAQFGVSRVVAETRERGSRPFAIAEQWGVEVPPVGGVATVTRLLRGAWSDGPRAHEFEAAHAVVVVEDAHRLRADEVAAMQGAVLRNHRRLTLVLVARTPGRLEVADAERVVVAPLDAQGTRQLVRRHVPNAGEVALRVAHSVTHGVPGDLLDLVRATPRSEWYQRRPQFEPTERHRRATETALAALTPDAVALMRALSVLRHPVPLDTALRLASAILTSDGARERLNGQSTLPGDSTPREGGVGPQAADALVSTGLVTVRGLGVDTRVRWAHPMTGVVVVDDLGPAETKRLHDLAANLTTDRAESLFHRVAASYGQNAGLAEELADFAEERATAGALGQAARCWFDAKGLVSDTRRGIDLAARAVDAYIGAGRFTEAELLLEELTVVQPTARVVLSRAYLAILRGRQSEAEGFLVEAERLAEDAETRALLAARRTLHHLAMCDGEGIVRWGDAATTQAPTGAASVEARAIQGLGLLALGRAEEGRALYDAVSHEPLPAPQRNRAAMGHGWLEWICDDPTAARALLESAISPGPERGALRITLWARSWLAATLTGLGYWDAALDHAVEAGRRASESGHELVRPLAFASAATVLALRGDSEGAHAMLRRGAAPVYGYPLMRVVAAVARAQVAEVESDYSAALAALEPVASMYPDAHDDPGFWHWPSHYANALVLTGQVEEAEEFLRPHLAEAQRRGRRTAVARLETVVGRIRAVAGDVEGTAAAFDRAMAQVHGLPLPLEHARLHFALGQGMRRLGRRREADRAMRTAREEFLELGAQAYVERCDRELKTPFTGPDTRLGPAGLTPQERAVVELVASGMTNKEAALELFVSVKTVQYHLTRIYGKLGVRSRSELAAKFAAGATDTR